MPITGLVLEYGNLVSDGERPIINDVLDRELPLSMERHHNPMLNGPLGYRSECVARFDDRARLYLGREIPPDVRAIVTRDASERAVQGGFGMSQAANDLVLRDLGLTSLQRQDTGYGQAMNLLETVRRTLFPPYVDIAQSAAQGVGVLGGAIPTASHASQAALYNSENEFNAALSNMNLAYEQ